MTEDEVRRHFSETGALLHGHFKLSSGLHSEAYLQCAKVLQWPERAGASLPPDHVPIALEHVPGEDDRRLLMTPL